MPFSTQKFVLLVEDEDAIIDTFEKVFENQSYALLDIARTIDKAILKIKFAVYDYIFLDMNFDGHRYAGMDVLRMLNRLIIKMRNEGQSVTKSVVTIMSGSVSLQDIMLEANALKVFRFFDKPANFTEEFLLEVVQELGLPLLPRQTKEI